MPINMNISVALYEKKNINDNKQDPKCGNILKNSTILKKLEK